MQTRIDIARENIGLEERRRSLEEQLRSFKPCKPPANDQLAFIRSLADERWVFGGNRSGKTHVGVADCLMFALGIHPVRSEKTKPPVAIRYCAPKWRDNVIGVLHRKFKQMVPRKALKGGKWTTAWLEKDHTLYFENGTTIQFKSYEEETDTYAGVDLDAVYQDEHSPDSIYKENAARLVDRNGFFVSTMTPEKGVTWEEDHVLNPTEGLTVEHWFFNSKHNPHLSQEGLEKLIARIKDPLLLEAKIEGQFVPLTGRVIPQWNPNVHIIPDRQLHPNALRVFCIDTHTKTPCAAMWGAWEPCDKYGYKLIVYRTMKRFLTVPLWKKAIIAASLGERIELWLGDEAEPETGVKNIYDENSILEQFRMEPNALPLEQVKKTKGSFNAGIFKLRDYFSIDPVERDMEKKSRIYVFESCVGLPETINGKPAYSLPDELRRFSFKKEQKADEESLREKVRNVNDHYISDLRYIAQAEPISNQYKSQGFGSGVYGNG